MESNGKSVRLDASPVAGRPRRSSGAGRPPMPRHAVFQLLHQGTHFVPVELSPPLSPATRLAEDHHRKLLINGFAQGAA